MSAWQPIETAPHDGTVVVVRRINGEHGEAYFDRRRTWRYRHNRIQVVAPVEWMPRKKSSAWRPISEAPKDGTLFLAYGHCPVEGHFVFVCQHGRYGFAPWPCPPNLGRLTFPQPTHFMPLPSPPEGS